MYKMTEAGSVTFKHPLDLLLPRCAIHRLGNVPFAPRRTDGINGLAETRLSSSLTPYAKSKKWHEVGGLISS